MIRALSIAALATVASALAVVGATGFYSWIRGDGLAGWLMFIHCGLGPVFAVALAGWATLRAEDFRLDRIAVSRHRAGKTMLFWLIVLTGLASIAAIMLSMLSAMPADWQPWLYAAHRYSSLALAVVFIGYLAMPRADGSRT